MSLRVTALSGFGGDGGQGALAVFATDNAEHSNATVHDYTINMPSGVSRAWLIIGLSAEDGSPITISSVVLDPAGENLTVDAVSGTLSALNSVYSRIYTCEVPSALIGAGTATLRTTFSGSVARSAVGILTVINLQSTTATFADGRTSATSSPSVPNVTCEIGGLCFAVVTDDSGTSTYTWGSDLTEWLDTSYDTNGSRISSAYKLYPAGRSASSESATGSGNNDTAMSVASFR